MHAGTFRSGDLVTYQKCSDWLLHSGMKAIQNEAMMNTITAPQAPAEWGHIALSPCHDREHCTEATHFWAGGAPGPLVE